MQIATWNVNGLRSRLDFLLHWLRARQPDVVGIQELKLEEDQFPRLELEAEGYHCVVHGQKAWNGVALLSREPMEIVQRGLPGQEDLGARLVAARAGDLTVTNVYVPNGKSVEHDDYPRKLAWLDDLAAWYRDTQDPQAPHVLCGDFNVTPAGLDTYDEAKLSGRVHHTDAERERLATLVDWGFTDSYRHRHPDTQQFSWWDYRGGAFHRNLGLRIDLLYATAPVVQRMTDVRVDRDYRKKKDGMTASDHAPVILDLD